MANDSFSQKYIPTIGSDIRLKNFFQVAYHNGSAQLWDSSGNNSMGLSGVRGSDVVILVFSRTNITSFQNLKQWKQVFLLFLMFININKLISNETTVPIILVGNKMDEVDNSSFVVKEEIEKWIKNNDAVVYLETR